MYLSKLKFYCVLKYIFFLNKIKFFLKKIRIENKNFNFYLDILSYTFLKSNHPDRIIFYFNIFKIFNFWKIDHYKYQLKNNIRNTGFVYSSNSKKKIKNKKIIFFGDSQVEGLSRIIDSKNTLVPENSKAYWIGPKTLIAITRYNNGLEIKKIINKIIKIENDKKYLLFSLGGIDIRCIFYELLLRKIVKNEKELFVLFKSSLENFLKEVIIKVKRNRLISGVGILALVNSSIKGNEPTTITKLLTIKENDPYPTFGAINTRLKWTKKANNIIKKSIKKYNVDFIGNDSFLKKEKFNVTLSDGVHLSSNKLINKLELEILKNAKNK